MVGYLEKYLSKSIFAAQINEKYNEIHDMKNKPSKSPSIGGLVEQRSN